VTAKSKSAYEQRVRFLVLSFEKEGLPLHLAVTSGNIDMVSLLLWQDVEIDTKDANGNTAFHIACEEGSLEMVEFLLLKGVNAKHRNNRGELGLHLLVARNFQDAPLLMKVIEMMHRSGVDLNSINKNGETPLHYVAKSKEISGDAIPWAANFLLELGADSSIKNKFVALCFLCS
jgi:ankyrin repeat protein